MIRKGLRPGFKFGIDLPGGEEGYQKVWPFRRSWVAIAVLLVMDVIFLIPAITTFKQVQNWGSFDSLFDLVGAVFLGAWLLGWSLAPLIMTAILVLMLFGREVLRIHAGTVEIALGLPFVNLIAVYDVRKMRNLRLEHPPKKSGSSWRGTHFLFDYGANQGSFGSDVSAEELTEIRNSIHMLSGIPVRRGGALPEDLETPWEPEEAEEDVVPLVAEVGPVMEPVVTAAPVTWSSPSTLALIIANLVPIAGTVFWGWELSDVLVLYWAESAVIGFFNVAKIVLIGRWFALFAGPFFLAHFGGFMAVHFLFVYTFFVQGPQGMTEDAGGDLGNVAMLFVSLWPALLALFVSHAYSFMSNFVARGEYRRRTVQNQMSEPYGRIIFMQLVLILGGGLSMVLGQTGPVLVAIIALKIFFDVRAHIKEHTSED